MDRLLRQFLEIADAGSVSAAAARLRVSQPGLSFNMKKLEKAFGVPLFVRSSRGMELSEYGDILVDHVRIMSRLDSNARATIEALRLRQEGGMRIGCGHAWWTLFVRDMVIEHGRRYPNAPVSIDVGNQFSCMDHLLSGDTTAFIGHRISGLSKGAGAVFEPLFSVRDALFVREGHPLVGTRCDEGEITEYGVVDSVPLEAKHRQLVDGAPAPNANPLQLRPPRHVFEASSLLACLDYVANSNSIMTYPDVMADYFRAFGLTALVLAVPSELKPIGLYTLGERKNDREVKVTVAKIRDAVENWLAGFRRNDRGASPQPWRQQT